jgi:uncharacterized protein YcbK (DUF882 family)
MWGHRGNALAFEAQQRHARLQQQHTQEQANRQLLADNGVEVAGLSQSRVDEMANDLRQNRPALAKAS